MKTIPHGNLCLLTIITVLFAIIGVQHAAAAALQYTNEFWISTNATGLIYPSATGGTIDLPFDGSTAAKFDTNMNSFPANSRIHIMPGTYATYGDNALSPNTAPYGFMVKPGQKIIGSGIGVTVLQLVSGTANSSVVIDGNGLTNNEVEDLTCDANGGYPYTYHGVVLYGNHIAIRRVQVIHCSAYTTSLTNYLESFGISIGNGMAGDSIGNMIEECEVSSYNGNNYDNDIASIGFGPGPISGNIVNNRVVLSTNVPTSNGINLNATHDCLVEGNYIQGAVQGVYQDTGGTTNLTVIDNSFVGCSIIAEALGAYGTHNLTFAFNHASLTGNVTAFAIGNGTVLYTNVDIFGNVVDLVGMPSNFVFVYGYYIAGLTIANNSVTSGLTNQLTGCRGVSEYNNLDSQGNYSPGMNIPVVSPTFFISPPDSVVGTYGGGMGPITVGLIPSLGNGQLPAWICASNSSGAIQKNIPLPNDFWSGKLNYVTSYTVRTTVAGNYSFAIEISGLLTNDLNDWHYQTVAFTAPSGTNTITISATNTLTTANLTSLMTDIYTGNQVQPGNFSILSGKVTAQ